jgi:hypothetical protein
MRLAALEDKVKQFEEVKKISNALEKQVNKTTSLRKHIQKREEKAEGHFTALKQSKDESYRQHEALSSQKTINEHRIQSYLKKVEVLRAMNMEITEERDSHVGTAFSRETLTKAQKAWVEWKGQLQEAKKREQKAKDDWFPLHLHLDHSAYYRDWSGQQLFDDLDLEFTDKTLDKLSKRELQTLKKAMKVFGFPAARDLNLKAKSRPGMIDELSTALGMPTPELMMEDDSGDKEVETFRARWKAIERQALLGGGSDFDDTSDGSDDSDDIEDSDDVDGSDCMLDSSAIAKER